MRIFKRKKPLCFTKNMIVFGDNNEVILKDICSFKTLRRIFLPSSLTKRILGKSKLISRLLRLEILNAVYHGGMIHLTYNNRIYSIDLRDYTIKVEFEPSQGKVPLNLTVIENISGIKDGIYFGEYFSNPTKEAVRIFRRIDTGDYEVVHTFEKGKINHIHNIISDHYNKCVWVLTGDFGDAAAIWRFDNNFEKVRPVLISSQQYRACVAFPTKDGLLYATDSQFEENNIRLLSFKDGKVINKIITAVNGSVIYGCKIKDFYFFSTTSEPVGNSSSLSKYFTRKKGPGIKKNESHILCGNLEQGFKTIYKNKKDSLPYGLFQFGTILFPTGKNSTEYLFYYSKANKTNDM